MKIKMNIDTQRLQGKPTTFDGRLRNRLCSAASIREVTPEQLMKAVREGCSFTPAVMTGKTGDTWKQQQVICADIDNDTGAKDADGHKIRLAEPLTPERARGVMAQYGIDPYFMYYSFSNAEQWPKFRIVLILDAPLTDPGTANDLIARFTGIFNALYKGQTINENGKIRPVKCADTSIKDNARLFYGGRSDSVFYISGKVTPVTLLQALPVYQDDAESAGTPAGSTGAPREYRQAPTPAKGRGRTLDELKAMFEADKENFDLAEYVQTTTTSRPHRVGRELYFNPCPLCGHYDDFQVTGALYRDHGASGGTGGTIIDYLMHHDKLSRAEAIDKFKFEIMGYDRDEWRRAYIAAKYPDAQGGNYGQAWGALDYDGLITADTSHSPETDAQNGAGRPETPAGDNLPAADTKAPENGAQASTDAQASTGAQGAQPAGVPLPGLMTYDGAIDLFKDADDRILELKTFPAFSKTAKIKRHDSIVIAADTGAGKSSLALNFLNDLNEAYPCIYFNLEMDTLDVMRRLAAIHSGIELDRIEGYKHDERTAAAVNISLRAITNRQPLQVVQGAYMLQDIEAIIRQSTRDRKEPTIVFIDHSLLVDTKKSTGGRYDRFTQISEGLRKIALNEAYNVIIFVLLQQSRAGKSEEGERPKNSSLKESGSWENDATHICFLWYDPTDKRKKLLMTKNRHGIGGEFTLNYWAKTQTYAESDGKGQAPRTEQATRPASKRDRQRLKLENAYRDAYIMTDGKPTLRTMAEAADVTTATVRGWIKEYGGCTVDGLQQDPAGIDTEVEYTGFIRLTPGDNSPFDEQDTETRKAGRRR